MTHGTLNNCTLTGNSASYDGGGAYRWHAQQLHRLLQHGAQRRRITTPARFNYCCTTPLPRGRGQLHQCAVVRGYQRVEQSAPPGQFPLHQRRQQCLRPRPDRPGRQPAHRGGTVDVGAYEFQFADPFHAWLAQYGLPTDGSATTRIRTTTA